MASVSGVMALIRSSPKQAPISSLHTCAKRVQTALTISPRKTEQTSSAHAA